MHAGVYTEDAQPSGQCLFICERKALHDLCIGLTETCSCLGYASWRLESFIQVDSVPTHTCTCMYMKVERVNTSKFHVLIPERTRRSNLVSLSPVQAGDAHLG